MFAFVNSLKFRILGGVFLVFSLAMAMVLYGVWIYQREKLVEQAVSNARQTGMVIDAGLRSSMVLNDRAASMETINKMLQLDNFKRINILNLEGRIIMSNDPAQVGRLLEREKYPGCMICHKPGEEAAETTVVMEDDQGQFLRSVTPIRNEPACYGCHLVENENVGVLLIDFSLARVNALIADFAWRIILIGSIVFFLGAILLHYLITRFFTKPLDALLLGFSRVGRGDFSYWVEVDCGGELAEMADSFNIMSRAIGRYVNEVRDGRDEIERHCDIVEALSQSIEKKELREAVVSLLYRLFDAKTVSFAMPMENRNGFFEVVNIGSGDQRHYHFFYDVSSGPLPPATALSIEDLEALTDGRYKEPEVRDGEGKLLIPLYQKNMPLGLVSVQKDEQESFSASEKKIIPVVAHHISIAFTNAQLYAMAVTDSLTSLYTKRYFLQKLDELESAFQEGGEGFWVLFFDLDHFKEVNDRYGHQVGDQVLTRVAELILLNIRHGDVACRYGGEEFVVLLQGDDLRAAQGVAERIRISVEKYIFTVDGIPSFSRTISVGLAGFPVHGETAERVVSAADGALYRAKARGRNRVEIWEPSGAGAVPENGESGSSGRKL